MANRLPYFVNDLIMQEWCAGSIALASLDLRRLPGAFFKFMEREFQNLSCEIP